MLMQKGTKCGEKLRCFTKTAGFAPVALLSSCQMAS